MAATQGVRKMPNGTAEQWEAGWRKRVDERLGSGDKKFDTLIEMMQGLITRMTVLEGVVGEIRDAKKTAPRLAQGWVNIALWLIFGSISALCGGGGFLIGLYTLLSNHWH